MEGKNAPVRLETGYMCVDGAAQAVGQVILSGLLAQVGAVCRTHGFDRDSSLKVTVGRRD
jgi:hypothetical protein